MADDAWVLVTDNKKENSKIEFYKKKNDKVMVIEEVKASEKETEVKPSDEKESSEEEENSEEEESSEEEEAQPSFD